MEKKTTPLFLFFFSIICVSPSSALFVRALLPPLPVVPNLLNYLDARLANLFPAIQHFKQSITKDPLNITGSWTGNDVCHYKGFFCGHPPDNNTATTVSSIDFNGFDLSAPSLDHFIDQFKDIAIFHANSNKFGGNIKDSLEKLPYLYELDISNNDLSGTFPMSILGMQDLSFLDIRFNKFEGQIPHDIFNRKVDSLFINNNNFAQQIPENIGSTPAIYLSFANNKFTGPIPRSIGNASETLEEVLFLNNQLSGCIPYEIGNLHKARLLDASCNKLTGPLPCSLGCLKSAEIINFSSNELYGVVPEVLCEVPSLVNLTLSHNFFTKLGPKCRQLMDKNVLDMKGNCVPGLPHQRPEKECNDFSMTPRSCPNPSSYTLIPCGGGGGGGAGAGTVHSMTATSSETQSHETSSSSTVSHGNEATTKGKSHSETNHHQVSHTGVNRRKRL